MLKDAGAVLVEGRHRRRRSAGQRSGFSDRLYETVVDLGRYLAGHGSPMRYADVVAQVGSPT
jgi:hypothetical protein